MKQALSAVIAIIASVLALDALAHGPRCPESNDWELVATQEACLYYRTSDGAGFWFEFEPQLPRDATGTVIGPAYRLWVCSRQGAPNEEGFPNYCFAPAFVDEVVPDGHQVLFQRWTRSEHHDLYTHRRLGGNRALRVEPQRRWHLEQRILPPLVSCLSRDFDSVWGQERTVSLEFLNDPQPRWCPDALQALRGPSNPGAPIRSPWGEAQDVTAGGTP